MKIAAIREQDIDAYRAVFDSVARELRYLGRSQAPPAGDVASFVRDGLTKGRPQFLGWAGEQVVGWCDIIEKFPDLQRHSGVLGMGVVATHRRKGYGAALMDATLTDARRKGFARVELAVRVDNEGARRLYERFGFQVEGICRKFIRVGDAYHDSYLMAVLYD